MRIAVLALALVPATALADVVVLEDGQRFEGVVTERGDTVEVQMAFGTVGFERAAVKTIERGTTALHELERRRVALRPGDLSGTLALARWAEAKGLTEGARALYRRALRIAPDHAEAHQALGHRQHEGRWLDEADYLRATGHVNYGGEWVTRDEAAARDERLAARREAREAAEAAERAERAAARAEAAKRAAEEAAKERESLRFWGGFNWGWNGWGWVPGQVGVRPPFAPIPRPPGISRPNVRVRPAPQLPTPRIIPTGRP